MLLLCLCKILTMLAASKLSLVHFPVKSRSIQKHFMPCRKRTKRRANTINLKNMAIGGDRPETSVQKICEFPLSSHVIPCCPGVLSINIAEELLEKRSHKCPSTAVPSCLVQVGSQDLMKMRHLVLQGVWSRSLSEWVDGG